MNRPTPPFPTRQPYPQDTLSIGGQSLAAPILPNRTSVRPSAIPPVVDASFSAALYGAVIGGANAFGRNIHRMQRGEMSMPQALARSLMHGAATSIATTTAAILTANLSESEASRLTALAVTAAGLSYLSTAAARKTVEKKMAQECT